MDATPLSREIVSATAIAIIDRDGLGALTMNAIGDELGVTGMAVYKHFPSKSALLDAVLGSLLEMLPAAPAAGTWQERLRAVYLALWELFEAHPNALPLVSTQPLQGPAVRRGIERAERVLTAAGFPEDEARQDVTSLTAYTLGFAGLVAGGWPAGGAGEGAASPAVDWAAAEREYARGLEALLRGIEAQIH